ncbi:hypothetical protein ACKC9G_18465 [Pokkaliibacter sp. CJK22405]|uniref:hypothetical protein n=1 Tax=Pokkaliibacter sp. CJK22405 TaxID=3384615 RepID=UPI00398470E8
MEIQSTLTGIDKALQAYNVNVVDRALRSTYKQAGQKAATLLHKYVGQRYNIGRRDLRANMKARYRASPQGAETMLLYSGPRLSLMYFSPQEVRLRVYQKQRFYSKTTRKKDGSLMTSAKKFSSRSRMLKGVSVIVRKDKGRVRVKGAFMAQGQRGEQRNGWNGNENISDLKQGRGNVQIFKRKGRARLPINRLTTLAVAQMVDATIDDEPRVMREIGEMVASDFDRMFSANLEHFNRVGGE